MSRLGVPRKIADEPVALVISKTLEEQGQGWDALAHAVDGGGDGLEPVGHLTDLAGGRHQAALSCLAVSYVRRDIIELGADIRIWTIWHRRDTQSLAATADELTTQVSCRFSRTTTLRGVAGQSRSAPSSCCT